MTLSRRQAALLADIRAGDVLKVHRTLDGAKQHRLHRLNGGPACHVEEADVDALIAAGHIASNMKFPAATYVLVGLF